MCFVEVWLWACLIMKKASESIHLCKPKYSQSKEYAIPDGIFRKPTLLLIIIHNSFSEARNALPFQEDITSVFTVNAQSSMQSFTFLKPGRWIVALQCLTSVKLFTWLIKSLSHFKTRVRHPRWQSYKEKWYHHCCLSISLWHGTMLLARWHRTCVINLANTVATCLNPLLKQLSYHSICFAKELSQSWICRSNWKELSQSCIIYWDTPGTEKPHPSHSVPGQLRWPVVSSPSWSVPHTLPST
jgi:hypothetical protein